MVTKYTMTNEQIQEVLADFENRLSYLENWITPSDASMSTPSQKLEPSNSERVVIHRQSSMTAQEHDILEQLVKRVDWLTKKLL